MKVKVSKRMAKFLSENISGIDFEMVKMSTQQYQNFVDIDIFANEYWDLSYDKSGTPFMKAIRVSYDSGSYACARYLTTIDLLNAFEKSDGTINGFLKEVKNEVEI